MTKKSNKTLTKSQANHKTNQKNANKRTPGVNKEYAAVQHNRAIQMDPNQ